MPGLTNTREQALLDNEFGSGTPVTLFLALFTTMPADDGSGGVEVSGGAYARVSVTNNNTNFPAASAGNPSVKNLAVSQSFVQATTTWGVVKGIGWFDASSAGNLRWAQDLIDSPHVIEAVTTATDLLTATTHGLVANDKVEFRCPDGSLPAGLTSGTVYYVIATGLTANDFKVSATLAGGAVDITTIGYGTIKVYKSYQQEVQANNTVSFGANALKMQLD